MKQNIQAVIFDMDGTLADSERIYQQAEIILLEELGISVKPGHDSSSFIGQSGESFMQWLKDEYQLEQSIDELNQRQINIFLTQGITKLRGFTPTIDFLRVLALNKIPLALASGSSEQVIDAVLGKLKLRNYFQSILSSESVGTHKPEPDVFLRSAEELSVPPQHCLVIEDSYPGLLAAKAAGMQVVTVNSHNDKKFDSQLGQADVFFEDMEAFSLSKIFARYNFTATACTT